MFARASNRFCKTNFQNAVGETYCLSVRSRSITEALNFTIPSSKSVRKFVILVGSEKEVRKCHVPIPTWSVRDLELTSSHPPVFDDELKRLSRLVLIDGVIKCGNDAKCVSDELKNDLGNMLHMLHHVTVCENRYSSGKSCSGRGNLCAENLNAVLTYDNVRGVGATELRREKVEDPIQSDDQSQAQDVWRKYMQENTVCRPGGHVYFAIETTKS